MDPTLLSPLEEYSPILLRHVSNTPSPFRRIDVQNFSVCCSIIVIFSTNMGLISKTDISQFLASLTIEFPEEVKDA